MTSYTDLRSIHVDVECEILSRTMNVAFIFPIRETCGSPTKTIGTISVKQKPMNQCLSWRFRGIHVVMNIVVARLDYVLYDPTFYNECSLGCASL